MEKTPCGESLWRIVWSSRPSTGGAKTIRVNKTFTGPLDLPTQIIQTRDDFKGHSAKVEGFLEGTRFGCNCGYNENGDKISYAGYVVHFRVKEGTDLILK
ncbi:hypothetical protein OSTOST_13317 [Ostertagia ostertagi]